MTVRTSKTTVTFSKPFVLEGFDDVLPSGAYDVETDEEPLEGLSFLAYRRTLTVLHLRPEPGRRGFSQSLVIDPLELEAALRRDRAASGVEAGRDAAQGTPHATARMRRTTADRCAIERGENEGMAVRQAEACRGP